MILVDMNQISLASMMMHLHISKSKEIDEKMVRHMILNSLRMYRTRFSSEFGELVLCYDSRHYWRRDYFPEYKFARRKSREKSPQDWDAIFLCLNKIKDELKDNLPYKFLEVYGAEADDIIGTLCATISEEIMIISGDKDFIQLQKFQHTIHQWSPVTKKLVNGNDPNIYLQEHIIKGDKSDGIPNILSTDNSIVEGIRQRPITKKYLQNWTEMTMNDDELRNYHRNQKLIDLAETPKEIETEIMYQYNQDQEGGRKGLLNFFIEKKLNNLIGTIGEF